MKIVLLPLDERPCNMCFPERLFSSEKVTIVRPEKLGEKKKPADIECIVAFLRKECKDADGLILSMDTLLYGGLVPSRIHNQQKETLLKRMAVLREIRQKNENLSIYAFQVIMRCPDYSSSDEEPDYYDICGKQIHDAGAAVHKSRLGLDEEKRMAKFLEKVKPEYLNDYISRREINRYMNVETLQYVRDGIIDALVIPQDDSSTYGYAAMDQKSVREKISEYRIEDKALMYPGTDEVELTLFARMVNAMHGKKPKVYVKYAADAARELIPIYEGGMLSGTIKYHILSAGCQLTESYEQADIILAVTAPAGHMEEAVDQPSNRPEYYAERNLPEMIDFIKDRLAENKIISIVDNAYANGGELNLIRMLDKNELLLKVSGYAGWNTSANTLGTAIAEAVEAYHYGIGKKHQSFLLGRYLEDVGYCSVVRNKVAQRLSEWDMNYFDVKESDGKVSVVVREELERFAKEELTSIVSDLQIKNVSMPWKRMFEVNLEIEYCGNERLCE